MTKDKIAIKKVLQNKSTSAKIIIVPKGSGIEVGDYVYIQKVNLPYELEEEPDLEVSSSPNSDLYNNGTTQS